MLEEIRLEPLRGVASEDRGAFTLVKALSKPLYDGGRVLVSLQARDPLPERIDVYDTRLRLSATANGDPVRVAPEHEAIIYTTWGKPGGRVEMHPEIRSKHPFPETGPLQAVTLKRLDWAVRAARGADSDIVAMRRIFKAVQVGYRSGRRYPTPADPPRKYEPLTGLVPLPTLHHYLWLALVTPHMCECQDLAAALRMPARILGIGGRMDVRFIFPWPPWDAEGKRRAPRPGEPLQGSLRPYLRERPSVCAFFDRKGHSNQYEGVLRWIPAGDSRAILYALGIGVYDYYTADDLTGTMDDRNANLFFMPQPPNPMEDLAVGRYKLGMFVDENLDRLRVPAYEFLDHRKQTLFQFHYEHKTFQQGDDKQVDKHGRLKG